jgi:Cu-Zn family superoxide dismutase
MKAIVLWERGSDRQESISEDDSVDGYVLFSQSRRDKPVTVKVYLHGLPDGAHGFHIHEKKLDVSTMFGTVQNCCDQLGGHFNTGPRWSPENPEGTMHGDHTGDLCMNIYVEEGEVDMIFTDAKISLFPGENCIVDRSLVIHQNEDDLGKGIYEEEDKNNESKITGNAGKRIACGNINVIY